MVGLTKFKKILLIIIVVTSLLIYLIFWHGLTETYKISPTSEKKFGCFYYTSDDDIKNIARNNIIDKFGEDALEQQKSLKVTRYEPNEWNNNYVVKVAGRPNGILKAIWLHLFSTNYIHPLTATYEVDNKDSCLVLKSILYQKN